MTYNQFSIKIFSFQIRASEYATHFQSILADWCIEKKKIVKKNFQFSKLKTILL